MLAPATEASGRLRTVGRDPYASAFAFHATAVGADTVASGSTIVAAFQLGRFYSEATNLGFAVSSDEGSTWTGGTLPETTIYADPPGPYSWVSYPKVAYDEKHGIWLISGIGGLDSGSDDAFISRSSKGRMWGAPIAFGTTFFGAGGPPGSDATTRQQAPGTATATRSGTTSSRWRWPCPRTAV